MELEKERIYYFDLGVEMGKNLFNLSSFLYGWGIGISTTAIISLILS